MSIEVPMSFRVPPRENEIATATLDISGTGVSFLTDETLKLRQELLVYLQLPGSEKIEIHAKIVRLDSVPDAQGWTRVGVKIVDPIKFDERKLVKFYSQKLVEVFGKGKYQS